MHSRLDIGLGGESVARDDGTRARRIRGLASLAILKDLLARHLNGHLDGRVTVQRPPVSDDAVGPLDVLRQREIRVGLVDEGRAVVAIVLDRLSPVLRATRRERSLVDDRERIVELLLETLPFGVARH